jgi:hypothetical protein
LCLHLTSARLAKWEHLLGKISVFPDDSEKEEDDCRHISHSRPENVSATNKLNISGCLQFPHTACLFQVSDHQILNCIL